MTVLLRKKGCFHHKQHSDGSYFSSQYWYCSEFTVISRKNTLTTRKTKDQSILYICIQNITIPWREIGEKPGGSNIMHEKDLGPIPDRSGDAWEGIRSCQRRACDRLVHHCRPKIRLHHRQTRCWNRSEWGPILCYQTQAPVRPWNLTSAFGDQAAAVEEKASRRTDMKWKKLTGLISFVGQVRKTL